MAHISMMTGEDTFFHPLYVTIEGDALQTIEVSFNLPGSGHPYERTNFSLHGTPKEILRFGEAIVASVRASKTVKEFQAELSIAAEGLDAAGMNE